MKSRLMRKLSGFLGCLFLLLGLCIPAQADFTNADADIDAIFARFKTVGGAVLVAKHGKLLYEHYYGYANVAEKKPVDAQSYFRAASITKFVSGIGVMRLVESGKLSLDANISHALNMRIANPRYPDTRVTLRQLMTHTSGVKDTSGFSKLGTKLRSMLVDNARSNFSDREPGKIYVYSNFGAGIVGAMMEAVTGQSVNAYMTEQVFAPLGIDAAYNYLLLKSPENASALFIDGKRDGQAAHDASIPYEDTADPNNHYRTTIGSLWIRPLDLLKLATLVEEGGAVDGVRLLQPETVATMLASQSGVGSVSGETPYGLFTVRAEGLVPGVMLYGHQGSSSGFMCNTYFDPKSGYTFVMMTNGCDQRRDHNVSILARKLVSYTYPLMEQ